MEIDSYLNRIVADRRALIAVCILILIVAVYLRIALAQYNGFFEPDSFFYYAVVRQTITNHFIQNSTLALSGFPTHNLVGEAPGLPYITVLFYAVLQFIGISYYEIMRYIAVLFGLFDAVGAFLLARYLSKSNWLGAIAMFFVAVSNGNVARTAATVYRGDTFISIILIVALLFLLKALSEEKMKHQLIYAVLSGIVLSLGPVMWNGSPFIIVIYMIAVGLLLLYAFVRADEHLLYSTIILSICGLLLSALLILAYVAIGLARTGLNFTGGSFFVFFIPLFIAQLIAFYLVKKKESLPLMNSFLGRLILSAVVLVIMVSAVLIVLGGLIGQFQSTVVGTSAIGATTQELQRPTYSFLYSSFGWQLYLAPIGILAFIFFANELGNKHHKHLFKGIKINMSNGFLVVLAYMMVAAYLQFYAIRFNSIVSIPIAIFSAYAIYMLAAFCRSRRFNKRALIAVVAAVVTISYVYYAITFFYPVINGEPLNAVFLPEYLVLLIVPITIIYLLYAFAKVNLNLKYVFISAFAVLALYSFIIGYANAYTSTQANGDNQLFYNAMSWLSANTPHNSTVLTVWTDGSVVEGFGNRTSYVDSVGGENGTKIQLESDFLFNTSNDTQFLYNIDRPDYVVSRSYWYYELGGLLTEGYLNNTNNEFFVPLSGLNATSNATQQQYTFGNSGDPLRAIMIIKAGANGVANYAAFVGNTSGQHFYEIKNIIFLNLQTENYSIIQSNTTQVYNYTLMISYIKNNQTGQSEIAGATVLGNSLENSNLYKLTYLCNYYECAFGGPNVTARAVYINNDTRIIKLTYT